ncbi:MAG: IS1595 family transposase, partial [Nitrospirota bacterium]
TFYFHLKECEFRFNYRDDDIHKLVLNMFHNRKLF